MVDSAKAAPFSISFFNFTHDFQVLSFEGTEAISSLYVFTVEVVSEDHNVDVGALLGQRAFLQFGHGKEGVHGCIEHAGMCHTGRRLTHYKLTLVSALHYLQFAHHQRIFQGKNVEDIITDVLKGYRMLGGRLRFEIPTGPKREYCTQYGESDLAFVQRLCAEEGIAWHHQHSAEAHTLVFTDDGRHFPLLGDIPFHPRNGMVAEHPVVNQFGYRFSTRTSHVTRRDYDFKLSDRLMEGRICVRGGVEQEDYRYRPQMLEPDQCEAFAKRTLESLRSDYEMSQGRTDQPALRTGHVFTLVDHPHKACNRSWLLLSVYHEGYQPQVLEEFADEYYIADDKRVPGYFNTFEALPADIRFRPPQIWNKPVMGNQTARVTGPERSEVYCDEYGRVKIELPWDRAGYNSDRSSCWVRVATGWAGDNYGAVITPRVGMEVVVTYLDGDCDRPLITSCAPNSENPVPYPLPEHATRTVLRTHSSPRSDGYNELFIEDRTGQEKIYLRAQRDLEQLVLHDSSTTIQNDRYEQIERDSRSVVVNDRFEQVGRNSASLIMGNEQHTTEGERSTVIGGNEIVSIVGDSSTCAAGSMVIQGGTQVHVNAGNVVVDGSLSLTLRVGGQHLVITPAGIFSSVPIVQGGAPMPGLPALEAQAVSAATAKVTDVARLSIPQLAQQPHEDSQVTQQNLLNRRGAVCEVCEQAAAGEEQA